MSSGGGFQMRTFSGCMPSSCGCFWIHRHSSQASARAASSANVAATSSRRARASGPAAVIQAGPPFLQLFQHVFEVEGSAELLGDLIKLAGGIAIEEGDD